MKKVVFGSALFASGFFSVALLLALWGLLEPQKTGHHETIAFGSILIPGAEGQICAVSPFTSGPFYAFLLR